MSDGDNATPGRRRRADGDNHWLTRTPRRSPGAAPWERRDRRDDENPDEFRADIGADLAGAELDTELDDELHDGEPTGNHTDGVTVADLIAKVAGTAPDERPRRRRRTDPPAPPPPPRRQVPSPRPAPPTEIIEPIREPILEPVDSAPVDYEPLNYSAVDYSAVDYSAVDYSAVDYYEPADRMDRQDTEIIDAVQEFPDLSDRVPPTRVGNTVVALADDEPRRRRKVILAGRAAAALMAVLALVLTGGAWQWQSSKNHSLNRVSALDLGSRDIVDPNAQFGDENFLIVGTDSRIGQNSDMGAGNTEDAGGTRSDTVMLVNIPANRKRVVAVSFPRDLAITPTKCDPWDPQTAKYGPVWDEDSESYGPDEVYTETKLNSAYAVGGPKCLVKVVQKLSGLSVNRFMAVDFSGFAKMVDALGGVEVCSTTPLEDAELGTVLKNAGRQVIDGPTALNYVRARNVATEISSDYSRIKRQQRFLSSLLRSMISKEVFFSLSKLNNVVNMFIDDSYVDNIDTKDLVQLGQSLQGVNAGRITFVTVPTGETNSEGNEPPRVADMQALFDAIINDDPLPGEKNPDNTPVPGTPESMSAPKSTSTTAKAPTPPPAAAGNAERVDAVTTDPQDVTVHVSNSTGQTGLGTTAATELEHHGFNVTTPDDYPNSLTATTVFFSPGNEQAAATVASSFASPTIERVSGMGNVVQVVLGSDFNSVSAPQPSGSSVQVDVVHGTDHGTPTELPEDLTVTNAADTTCE